MAKQAVSPVERHLEKGVLGVALLLLAGVVVKFLIASPNTVDLGGGPVMPGEVYQSMVRDADELRNRIKSVKVDSVKPEDQLDRLKKLLDPKPEATLAMMVPWSPTVPNVATAKHEEVSVELVKVLEFDKPIVKFGRSGLELLPSEPVTQIPDEPKEETIDPAYVVPVNWVTVSAIFDVDAQRQLAQSKNYLPGQAIPYLAGAELERREKKWDGTYTEWTPVKAYARYVLPELPFVEVVEKDGKSSVPETTIPLVDAFSRVVQEGWYRLQLMRPLPAKWSYGDWWEPPAFEGLELLRMDDEVMNPPPATPACPFYDRYPKKPKPKITKDTTSDERDKQMNAELERRCIEIEDWQKQGCYEAAYGSVDDLLKNSFNEIKRLAPKRVEWLEKKKDELEAQAAKAKKEREDIEKGLITPPPRELLPQQVVWVHDAMQESVVSGRTYQYRMRPLLYNNLCGQIKQLKNPKDAEIVLLQGEWSKESDDVSIPSDTEFFLARGKEADKTARIEVFKWHEGEMLRSSFEVGIGGQIGERASAKVGAAGAPARIDFSTGSRVVDLRFDHPYRERKEKKGGFELAEAKPTLLMVYVDTFGELHERVLEEDKRDPRLKELKEALGRGGEPPGP